MPECIFFAAGTDHKAVLEFLLSQGDSDIYESTSRPDQPLRQFHSLADFEQHYSLSDWNTGVASTWRIHPHAARGRFISARGEPNPRWNKGAKFIHTAMGWGLVQLDLFVPNRPKQQRLFESHVNHNTENRANARAVHNPHLGNPADWEWKCVSDFSKRLNRFIRSQAVDKIGRILVLPHAAQFQKNGFILG